MMDRALKDCSKPSATLKNPYQKLTVEKLYEQRHETGDIKFIINSEEIPAHRCVLAAFSPKYKAQFYGPMSQKDTVDVEDVSSAAFKEFLHFFYMEKMTLTLENIEDVLNLAKQSLVDELIIECINFLFDVVGMDKLIWCYRLAIDYDIELLNEFCVKQISANIKSIFQTPDFSSYEQEMLCHILNFDSLNCDEIDIFNACIAWAQTKCEQEGVDAANVTNLRSALGDVFFKIRFCLMTADQFATIDEKYLGLLSGSELKEICHKIILKGYDNISSVFGASNSRPRRFTPLTLEYPQKSYNTPIMINETIDSLRFFCDKAINLNGFVISKGYPGEFDVYVLNQKRDFTTLISSMGTIIIFDNPIYVEANKRCRINVELTQTKIHGYEKVNDHPLRKIPRVRFMQLNSIHATVICRLLYDTIIE